MRDKDCIVLKKIAGYVDEALVYTQAVDFAEFSRDRKTINATVFVR